MPKGFQLWICRVHGNTRKKDLGVRFPLSTTCFIESFHNTWVAVEFACEQGPGLNPTCQPSAANSLSSLSCPKPTLGSHTEAINIPGLTSKREVG